MGVDQSSAGATRCSIDGLFRVLQGLESSAGASLIGGGRVFYRDDHAAVQSVARAEVAALAAKGTITKDTVVFDTSLTDLGTFRACLGALEAARGNGADAARHFNSLVHCGL